MEESREKLLNKVIDYVQEGSTSELIALIGQALEAGISPEDILSNGLLKGMSQLGEDYKNSNAFVPEVLIAARAMNRALEYLRPYLRYVKNDPVGTVVIGTVKGDIHNIGKKMVCIMMESHGLHVIDLGVDVAAEVFYEKALEHHADVVCCSALLTTCTSEMKKVVQLFIRNGMRDRFRIMIGGAAVSQRFCDAIGADCYTEDASSAAVQALQYCRQQRGKR